MGQILRAAGPESEGSTHEPSEAAPPPPIAFDDFLKVDIRVGTIVAVEPFHRGAQAGDPARIDFGPAIGRKKSSAQITGTIAGALVGRQVPPSSTSRRGRSASPCRRC